MTKKDAQITGRYRKIRVFLKKPEIIIALLSLFFGLVFVFAIKPLQIPDEPNHFIRAYQVSEGGIFQKIDSDGECFSDGGTHLSGQRVVYSNQPKSITKYADGNRDAYNVGELIKTPLNPSDKVNICARQTAANSPIGYLPQAMAIAALRIFDASPVLLNYAARIAILVTWVAFVYFAIRIIPVRKWTAGSVVLLPMAIQQSMAIGADVLSIAPVMVVLAMLIRSYYEKREGHITKDLAIMSGLVAIAALSKPVMIVLILLLPFYNTAVVKDQKKKVLIAKLCACLVPVVIWLIWSALASHNQLSVTDVFPKASGHVDLIKDNPIEGLTTFALLAIRYIFYDLSLWGFGSFEWFTVHLPQPLVFIGIANLILILLVGYNEKVKIRGDITQRHIIRLNSALVITALAVLIGNIFTLFIIYTQPGAWKVEGMQFRYLIPVFLVLASIIGLKFLHSSERFYRNFVLINACVFFFVSVAVILHWLPSM